ncbi:DUF885 domain-containing protein [Corynebacterium sp. H130]|uniref:DUF885 domain-containing protein n=1 Tax=Corynebacterium sp. H130 TaxID=3133444 RepID=UPI0030B06DDA
MSSSLLDATCEAYVLDVAKHSPTDATAWGIPGHDGELQDFSPAYWDGLADLARNMLADVDALEDDFTPEDELTAAILRDRLGIELDLHHRAETYGQLNNIASPVQTIRDSFSLMSDPDVIRARLSRVPAALSGYRESLALAAGQGRIAAQRQVELLINECNDTSFWDTLEAPATEVEAVKRAHMELATWLSEQLAGNAPTCDGVGRERYELFSRHFLGATVDLDEAYSWGLDELERIVSEQEALARELYGCGVEEAKARLNKEHVIHGVSELKKWMQGIADSAVATYGTPPIECCIDPAGTGGIFYTPPAEDGSRLGRMWWSVAPGEDTFYKWQELTTVYHEGAPGHHMQITAAMAAPLNLWRRVACWNSGHGEGWALYAENLIDHEPATRMGLLDAQRLRAARVVLDIGVHLGKKNWDAAYARNFLRENCTMSPASMEFEINRYLGWPGQAPSYALGQRLWEEIRDNSGLPLDEFHSQALSYGSIPLGLLKEQF